MALKRHMRIVDEGSNDSEALGLKFAFATTDMKSVNQHFGSAESFAMYSIDPDNAILVEAAQFGKLDQDGNEDKLQAKIQMLESCVAVYCQAVGASAMRQLLAKGVQPIKVPADACIDFLIESIQSEMKQGPSAWLAKAIKTQQGPDIGRFDAMEEEGWDEN